VNDSAGDKLAVQISENKYDRSLRDPSGARVSGSFTGTRNGLLKNRKMPEVPYDISTLPASPAFGRPSGSM
jgi:hypothetical protein